MKMYVYILTLFLLITTLPISVYSQDQETKPKLKTTGFLSFKTGYEIDGVTDMLFLGFEIGTIVSDKYLLSINIHKSGIKIIDLDFGSGGTQTFPDPKIFHVSIWGGRVYTYKSFRFELKGGPQFVNGNWVVYDPSATPYENREVETTSVGLSGEFGTKLLLGKHFGLICAYGLFWSKDISSRDFTIGFVIPF